MIEQVEYDGNGEIEMGLRAIGLGVIALEFADEPLES
jgi:hypothetical protein